MPHPCDRPTGFLGVQVVLDHLQFLRFQSIRELAIELPWNMEHLADI